MEAKAPMRFKRLGPVVASVALLAAVAGCSSGGSSGGSGGSGPATVNWWTWDPNQALAYEQCIPAFEKANPGIKVDISQYNVAQYFTKLTASFVAGNAPDAFMNSVTYLQSYASQNQLMPLNKYISQSNLDMSQYSIGTSGWKYTNGDQYALPMDWATNVLYYNSALVEKAGYTQAEMDKLTWNPQANGGTLWTLIKRLTTDKNGVRGDQPGFKAGNVSVYGFGNMEATGDPFGQSDWGMLLADDNINIPNQNKWATEFNYANPQVVQSVSLIRDLSNDGYSPQLNQFTAADTAQIGSGDVAMSLGGTWEAGTFLSLPNVKIGIAPLPLGSDGTRRLMANSNGNNMGRHEEPGADLEVDVLPGKRRVPGQGSRVRASFLPSIGSATDALVTHEAAKGQDLSVFANYVKQNELFPSPVYNNGAAIANYVEPQFQAYFTNKAGSSIFGTMQAQVKTLLSQQS